MRFVEHNAALLAIPAALPALVVVGVIAMIAVRDRQEQRRKAHSGEDSQ